MDKILIIEDSPIVQKVLDDILGKEYELGFRDDGLSGLAAAQTGNPDIILLDIRLPIMDGYDVCKTLKTNEATHDIPIIFLTSLDSEAEKVKGFEAGANDYVVKPFYNKELHARIKAQLSFRKAKIQALHLERLTVFREMAVAIGHEFNNALTTVYAYLHILEHENEGSELATTSLSGLKKEFMRISEITNRLTNASRAENINYSSTIKMIDLNRLGNDKG
jgi:DNA-binding response OmpR family regulator